MLVTHCYLFITYTTISAMYFKNILAVAVACIAMACHRHSTLHKTAYVNTVTTSGTGSPVLLGYCSPSMLQIPPFQTWYDTMYASYQTDAATIQQLQPRLSNRTVEVFLGTWCGDSRREVPRLIKVLQEAHFDTSHLTLIFTGNEPDLYKQSPQHEERGRFIHRVPTIIVYNNGKEEGRIVETPVTSLEKDLLAIVSGVDYTPKYIAARYWQQQVKAKDKLMGAGQLQQTATALKPLCKSAGELNGLGYVLMGQKKYSEAINVLALNTLLYPENYNTYDSLAEAYAKAGDVENARSYYRKALELNPKATHAAEQLAVLQ